MNTAETGNKPLVLLTRPVDRAAPLAASLEADGIASLIWAVLDIRPVLTKPPELNGAQAIILTSPRAVESLPRPIDALKTAPAYCVGHATAAAARSAGFGAIFDADGDAGDLAALITANLLPGDGPLLYLRGQDVARDMVALLPGFEVRSVEGYRAAAMTVPDPAITDAIKAGNLTAIAFFSPRAAAIFAEAQTEDLRDGLAATTAVAMSERVAEKLNQIAFQSVVVAKRPTASAMRAAICGACGVAPPQNGVCD